MPIYKYVSKKNISYLIWEIKESENELLESSTLSQEETIEFSHITNNNRKIHWLAARVALKHIFNNIGEDYFGLYKNEFGKPLLIENDYNISISHCENYAVAALNKNYPIGIDIQKFEEKLDQVKTKFLSNDELLYNNMTISKLCVLWSAKEAIYKLISSNKISLKKDIIIKNFNLDNYDNRNNSLKASCKETEIFLEYEIFEKYVICYAVMK